uniref:Polysaccharide biosynthesis protein n=1 Tax=Ignavibacterium album TaxID=591197 RepID=A0A832D348_9BACT
MGSNKNILEFINQKIALTMTRIRNRYFFILDFLIFLSTPFLAFLVRFEGFNYNISLEHIAYYAIVFAFLKGAILYAFGIYSRWWNQASVDELLSLMFSGSAIIISQIILLFIFRSIELSGFLSIPFSVAILDALFAIIIISLTRFIFRIQTTIRSRKENNKNGKKENILIYGAGAAGVMTLEEIRRNRNSELNIAGFIDDEPKKTGLFVRGIKVLGDRNQLPEIVNNLKIKKVIIALPSASGKEIRDIISVCKKVKDLEILTVPPLYDIIDGKVEIQKLRKVDIDDLLRREPIKTDIDEISHLLKDKNVLVTGGGGSIGKEICRQVLLYKPKTLIILGHGENSVFETEMELKRIFPSANIKPFITNVNDEIGVSKLFEENQIDFIFHAAAHKHVPLMEKHPYEAIRNNVLGTKVVLDAALANNVKKFIMLSTDKAVNPTSVMGTTKRIAEMIVIYYAKKYKKEFSVVRFGNVLGSRGSVVKIFKSQIESGGPVTVTHPDIERYFMTIPESVQLVMQAFSMGNGGDIFVFDMGAPVKIFELAKNLINLSGLKENEDIDIKITGLRAGEKLYEELFNGNEKFTNTKNEKIYIAENSADIVPDDFEYKLNELLDMLNDKKVTDEEYKAKLKEIVSEYSYLSNFQKYIA